MYIIHALKELKLIVKKIDKNREKLREASSGITTILPEYKDKNKQTRFVEGLLQSNLDLAARYLKLKNCLAYTNAVSKITINGRTYSVTELIAIRKEIGGIIDRTYSAISDDTGKLLLSRYGGAGGQGKDAANIVYYYDAARKSEEEKKWYDFYTKIDAELEIFNARTFLLDPETREPIQAPELTD